MKNFAYPLIPVAILVLIGACATGILGFLVVILTSIGSENWIPVLYYWQFNLPLISVLLPVVGMILFAAILLGTTGERGEAINRLIAETNSTQEGSGEGKKEDSGLKAA